MSGIYLSAFKLDLDDARRLKHVQNIILFKTMRANEAKRVSSYKLCIYITLSKSNVPTFCEKGGQQLWLSARVSVSFILSSRQLARGCINVGDTVAVDGLYRRALAAHSGLQCHAGGISHVTGPLRQLQVLRSLHPSVACCVGGSALNVESCNGRSSVTAVQTPEASDAGGA